MNINLTLLGEMITFAILVWVTMKYIWPPIVKAMEERQKKIADGIAAGERGHKQLKLAEQRTADMLREVKRDSAKILEKANARSNQIIDEAKQRGLHEGQKLIESAKIEIQQQQVTAAADLKNRFSSLVIDAAGQILEKEIDQKAHDTMIAQLAEEI